MENPKNGIVFTRDFEVVEMSDLSATKTSQFTSATSYAVSTAQRKHTLAQRVLDGFRRHSRDSPTSSQAVASRDRSQQGRFYDLKAAARRTANSPLARDLKGRHLQMIAIGGSIGTGLFVTSGVALHDGGPASLLLAYILVGVLQFCTMQSMAELVVTFPVSGAFSALSTRFLDPSWGFAMGWNYALQWMFTLPLEIIAGALTIQYWNPVLDKAVAITVFLLTLTAINLFGIKGYGEAEFLFSTVKVTAIVGFILLGIVINIGGTPDSGYIGGQYWITPGATRFGFKGFCSVIVAASFSFGGTELVGLAAAEAANPRKTLPSAIKQVFWRITMFYVVALLLVGLLVPYNEPRLVGGQSSVDASASPFVIAVESAGQTILPSVMNAVILVAVLSVGNSSIYGASRTLSSLAEQSHAPRFLRYVDRAGRPLVAILVTSAFGLLAYLADVQGQGEVFDWLFALCGLSSLFTWMSICLCHIQFRRAWKAAGNDIGQLPFRSQSGVVGSYVALIGDCLVLVCQVWAAVSPVDSPPQTPNNTAKALMMQILALPIVILFYAGHKLWFRTSVVRVENMDIDTGRSFARLPISTARHDGDSWPVWKKVYRYFC